MINPKDSPLFQKFRAYLMMAAVGLPAWAENSLEKHIQFLDDASPQEPTPQFLAALTAQLESTGPEYFDEAMFALIYNAFQVYHPNTIRTYVNHLLKDPENNVADKLIYAEQVYRRMGDETHYPMVSNVPLLAYWMILLTLDTNPAAHKQARLLMEQFPVQNNHYDRLTLRLMLQALRHKGMVSNEASASILIARLLKCSVDLPSDEQLKMLVTALQKDSPAVGAIAAAQIMFEQPPFNDEQRAAEIATIQSDLFLLINGDPNAFYQYLCDHSLTIDTLTSSQRLTDFALESSIVHQTPTWAKLQAILEKNAPYKPGASKIKVLQDQAALVALLMAHIRSGNAAVENQLFAAIQHLMASDSQESLSAAQLDELKKQAVSLAQGEMLSISVREQILKIYL